MNVSLTPELERFVNDKVDTGMYQTASEVVREGLRLLKQRDEDRLGSVRDGNSPGMAEDIKAGGRARASAKGRRG